MARKRSPKTGKRRGKIDLQPKSILTSAPDQNQQEAKSENRQSGNSEVGEHKTIRRFKPDVAGVVLSELALFKIDTLKEFSTKATFDDMNTTFERCHEKVAELLQKYQDKQSTYLNYVYREVNGKYVLRLTDPPGDWPVRIAYLQGDISDCCSELESCLKLILQGQRRIELYRLRHAFEKRVAAILKEHKLYFRYEFQFAYYWKLRCIYLSWNRYYLDVARKLCAPIFALVAQTLSETLASFRHQDLTYWFVKLGIYFKIFLNLWSQLNARFIYASKIEDSIYRYFNEKFESWAEHRAKKHTGPAEKIDYWPDEQFGPVPNCQALSLVVNALQAHLIDSSAEE